MESEVSFNNSSALIMSHENLARTMLVNGGAISSDNEKNAHFTEAIYGLAEILSEMNLRFSGKTQ
jgi:hypothetical protein